MDEKIRIEFEKMRYQITNIDFTEHIKGKSIYFKTEDVMNILDILQKNIIKSIHQ